MADDLRARKLFKRISIDKLPTGVCLIGRGGDILECNRRARLMLRIPLTGPVTLNLNDLGTEPPARVELFHHVKEAVSRGDKYRGEPVQLRIGDNSVYVVARCQALVDPQQRRTVGYVVCLADVTATERYRRLLDQLPVGVFGISADGNLEYANDILADILGFDSGADIQGLPWDGFYARPGDAEEAIELLKHRGSIDAVEEWQKRDGERIYVSIRATLQVGPDGACGGAEGTVTDVTRQEHYRRLAEDIPVGLYQVSSRSGDDIITHCNAACADLFGLESPEALIGTSIEERYSSAKDYHRFMDEVEEAEATGTPLTGYIEKLQTGNGRPIHVEVSCRLRKDKEGRLVGRVGVIRDISREWRLRERMEDLRADIGRVLHSYSATLTKLRHSVGPALRLMEPHPFERKRSAPSIEEVNESMRQPIKRFAGSLEALLEASGSDWTDRGLDLRDLEKLSRALDLLKSYRHRINPPDFRPQAMRRTAREAIDLCAAIYRGSLPREAARNVLRDAGRVERIACVASLLEAEAEIIAMDHQVRALRDYVTSGTRTEPAPETVVLWDLVTQAMRNLSEYAESQGVEIKPGNHAADVRVEVVERDVVRALSNLLHNAIKYSWSREYGTPPWVSIETYEKDGLVYVAIENWGVPIPQDEIDSGLIFQLGYRGRLSSDRGRLGTGIGAADARRTARAHDGDVNVRSHPASRNTRVGDYTAAHLTTATFSIPVKSYVRGW